MSPYGSPATLTRLTRGFGFLRQAFFDWSIQPLECTAPGKS
jgi:hypothetical protein